MTGFDFLLGVATSLVGAAVDRVLVTEPNNWERRRVNRRIQSMTDAVMQPIVDYLVREKIDEETAKLIAKEAEGPVRTLIQNNDEMISRGLNVDAVASYVLESMLSRAGRNIADENPAAFDIMLRAFVDLAVRTPPLFADWEQKQFAAAFRKLEELEEFLGQIYGDMRRVAERHERGEALIDRIIVHQAGRLALKMSVHGLRSSELPQTEINNLFILPHFSEQKSVDGELKSPERMKSEQLEDCFSPGKHGLRCSVVAPAGAGKTTWIEWLGSRLLNGDLVSSLPVNVRLRQALKSEQLPTLLACVRSTVSPAFHDKFSATDLDAWIDAGKIFLLLDGFDEVAERERDRVFDWIEGLAAADPNINIVLTTRPLTTSHAERFFKCGYRRLYLEPFDDAQVEEYISKYQEFGPPIQTGAERLTPSELASTWRNDPSLGPLTANPLLLSTLLAVHHMDGELPQGRAALYERYVDGLLGAWETRKELTPPDVALTKQAKREILQTLAINMIANEVDAVDENEAGDWIGACLNRLGISASVRTVLEHLRERSGLLIGPGQYSFAHKSIGEFLVACACHDGIARDVNAQRFDRMLLTQKCHEDRWLMVTYLWSGIAPVSDVQDFLGDLIDSEQLGLVDGLLLEHGERLDPECRSELCWKFVENLNSWYLNDEEHVDDHRASFYSLPFQDAVDFGTHLVLERRKPGGQIHEQGSLANTAFRKKWIDSREWSTKLGKLSPDIYLSLLQCIGSNEELCKRVTPELPLDQQICWLVHIGLYHAFRGHQVALDMSEIRNYSDGAWRGIALHISSLTDTDEDHSSGSEMRDAFLVDLLERIGDEPPDDVLVTLSALEHSEREGTWHEKISKVIGRKSEFSPQTSELLKTARKIQAGCERILTRSE